jgi:hypothetical protein
MGIAWKVVTEGANARIKRETLRILLLLALLVHLSDFPFAELLVATLFFLMCPSLSRTNNHNSSPPHTAKPREGLGLLVHGEEEDADC